MLPLVHLTLIGLITYLDYALDTEIQGWRFGGRPIFTPVAIAALKAHTARQRLRRRTATRVDARYDAAMEIPGRRTICKYNASCRTSSCGM